MYEKNYVSPLVLSRLNKPSSLSLPHRSGSLKLLSFLLLSFCPFLMCLSFLKHGDQNCIQLFRLGLTSALKNRIASCFFSSITSIPELDATSLQWYSIVQSRFLFSMLLPHQYLQLLPCKCTCLYWISDYLV